jgi:hypothetical protein
MKVTGTPANADMVEGFLDGYRDDRTDLPASLANRSRSYRHGWLNGRDDRVRKPRASYEIIRAQAEQAMLLDESNE